MMNFQYKTQPFDHQRERHALYWDKEYLLSVRYSGIMQGLSSPASDSSGSCLYSDRLSAFQNCYRAIEMNYQKHYDALIQRARLRTTPEGYTERHHVIPRCMGGGNEKGNLVRLTAEEHFVAHQLLVKIHTGNSALIFAVRRMTHSADMNFRSNKLYGWIRRKFSCAMIGNTRGKGYRHSPEVIARIAASHKCNKHSLGYRHDEVAKQKISITHKGRILTDEHREKLSTSHIGNSHTDATRKKMSATRKGHAVTDCTRAKISAKLRGHVHSVETREKIRAAHLARRKA